MLERLLEGVIQLLALLVDFDIGLQRAGTIRREVTVGSRRHKCLGRGRHAGLELCTGTGDCRVIRLHGYGNRNPAILGHRDLKCSMQAGLAGLERGERGRIKSGTGIDDSRFMGIDSRRQTREIGGRELGSGSCIDRRISIHTRLGECRGGEHGRKHKRTGDSDGSHRKYGEEIKFGERKLVTE